MTTFMVRTTGSDLYGGTSASVRSMNTDGVTNGTNTFTSVTASWSAADVGHAIYIGGAHNVTRLITAVTNASTLTFSGATLSVQSGLLWVVGGAWRTVAKALGGAGVVSGGDAVYIGAGIYREGSFTAGFSPASSASFIGDVSGQYTGDVGDVILSAWASGDNVAPGTGGMRINGQRNLTFSSLCIETDDNGCVQNTSGSPSNIAFVDCTFSQLYGGSGMVHLISLNPAATGWTFQRCQFIRYMTSTQLGDPKALIYITHSSGSAAYDLNVKFLDCFLFNFGEGYILHNRGDAAGGSFGAGGLLFNGCTIFQGGPTDGITSASQTTSVQPSTYPVIVTNCIIVASSGKAFNAVQMNPHIMQDNNRLVEKTQTSTTVGGSLNKIEKLYPPLRMEFGQSTYQGRAPKPMFSPTRSSPLAQMGRVAIARSNTSASTVDSGTFGNVAWTTPSNAILTDNVPAIASGLTNGQKTNLIMAAGWGFSIPSDATILGVSVAFRRGASTSASINHAALIHSSASMGTAKTLATQWPTTACFSPDNLGGTNDLWGATLTPAIVNSATFGVQLSATAVGATSACLDGLAIMVMYRLLSSTDTDMLNRPRVSTSASNVGSVGAFEVHDIAQLETTIFDTYPAIKLVGPGDQEFKVAVDPGNQTLSIKCRVDSTASHTSPPQFILLANGEIGVTQQTLTATPLATAWETLTTATFNPTRAGVVTIRLVNRANTASGTAYFDTVT